MSIHIAVFISLSITITGSTGNNAIHKCCDVTQRLDYNLNCVDIPNNERGAVGENRWWISSDNSSIIADITSQKIIVEYGVTPECSVNSKDVLCIDHAKDKVEYKLITEHHEVFVEVLNDKVVENYQNEGRTIFPSSSFCVDTEGEGVFTVILCPCSTNVQCVRKCCFDSELFNMTTDECEEVQDKTEGKYKLWRPKIDGKKKAMYRLHGAEPMCEIKTMKTLSKASLVDGRMRSKLLLLEDDHIQNMEDEEIFLAEEYCGDYSTDNNEVLQFCSKPDEEADAMHIVFGVFLIISAIAILLTVLLTIVLPDMRKNIQAKMGFCHNIALLIFYTVTAIMHLGSEFSKVSCIVMSFINQFSMLASFFWLNVMCIDIAWVFSALRPIRGISSQTTQKKFIYYSVYACGSASCISIAMAIVEFTPGASMKPTFGEGMCFFNNWHAQLLFYYGPMALILIANISLYVYTTMKIITANSDSTTLNANDAERKNKKKKDDLLLFSKIFLLMGVTWISEVISWAVGGRGIYWVVTDVINLLRGVFIFVIFCCKRKVYEQVRDKTLRMCGKTPGTRRPRADTGGSTMMSESSRLTMSRDVTSNTLELTRRDTMDSNRSMSM